jgi:hypothetical protein
MVHQVDAKMKRKARTDSSRASKGKATPNPSKEKRSHPQPLHKGGVSLVIDIGA